MSKIYSMRTFVLFIRYCAVFVFMSFAGTISGQSLACNGGVNISMDSNCEVIMSSKHILKGPDANADSTGFILTIKNHDGTFPNDLMVKPHPDGTFRPGYRGVLIKFSHPGEYVVSVQRISDGVNCWGNLRIEDKLLPFTRECPCSELSNPLDEKCFFNCSSVGLVLNSDSITQIAGINPVFVDNCSDTGKVTFEDVLTPDTICGGWIITRTWKTLVSDFHGDNILKDLNCVQKFVFKSTGPDPILPPSKKVVVRCGIDTDPKSLRTYFSDTTYFFNPDPDTALVRAYPTLPDTVNGKVLIRPIGLGLLSEGSVDNYCKITATYTDSPIIPQCADIGYKFVRTWHIIDWCTNETKDPLTQIIKVMDNEPPFFKIKDTIDVTSTNPWSCDSDILVPAPDTMFDNCADLSQITWLAFVKINGQKIIADASNGYQLDGIGRGTYKVTYEVTDLCKNTLSDDAVIVIKDEVKPVALSKKQIKITFSSFQGECVAKVFPYNVDAGSFDACDSRLDYAIRRFGTKDPFGPFVKFTSLDLDDITPGGTAFGEVIIELKVTDEDGNFNIAWTTVILEDKNTDVTKDCGPDNISTDCTVPLQEAIDQYLPIVILDGCEKRNLEVNPRIRYSDVSNKCNTGNAVVDYFIEGSDDTLCTKTFHLGDDDDFQIFWPGSEITVTCDVTDFPDPVIINGNCNQAFPTETIREFTVPPGLGYCKKIIRTITVIDWCTYQPNTGDSTGIYRFVQTIKVKDLDGPVISCEDLELDAGDDCKASGFFVNASGSDSGLCADNLTWYAAIDGDGDGIYEIDLTPIPNSDETVTARVDSSLMAGVHNLRWRAIDDCGNSDEVICTITVTDNKPPSPNCIAVVSTATMNTNGTATIWAKDFDPQGSSTDNCDQDLTYSFSETDPGVPSLTFTCADLIDGVSALIDLKVYVWDDSGNKDFCSVRLRIDDNSNTCPNSNQTASAVISGMIATTFGDRLESAEVISTMMNGSQQAKSMTNLEGEFVFSDHSLMMDYEIGATKEDPFLNGVSTVDLILIQRHILGLSLLDDPYKVIAADVNDDARVSALDLVMLRNLILGRITELPHGKSWKFIDAAQTFSEIDRPWPLWESIYVNELFDDQEHQDFIAVKLGDINGNAIVNSLVTSRSRSAQRVQLPVEDKRVKEGDRVSFSLDMDQLQAVYGMQFELQLNDGQWIGIDENTLGIKEHHLRVEEQYLKLSWNSSLPVNHSPGLNLSFVADKDGMLSEFIEIVDEDFEAQVYFDESIQIADLELKFYETLNDGFQLFQNVPNPFSTNTSISFIIPEKGNVDFAVFDVTGRQVFAFSDNYDSGRHEIVVDDSILERKGVYYYQLSYGNMIATKKMISID